MLSGGKMTTDVIEEIKADEENAVSATIKRPKAKRDVIRFPGEKPSAINLEHVTQMGIEGKKITFQFYSTAMFIELADEAAAASAFEVILNIWAGEAQ